MIWQLTRSVDLLGRPVLASAVEPETHLRKYDPAWLDGREHTVWRGCDFTMEARRMSMYLHGMARDHGGRMTTTVAGDSVTFRFTKESP